MRLSIARGVSMTITATACCEGGPPHIEAATGQLRKQDDSGIISPQTPVLHMRGKPYSPDVCVYGGTASGVMAAVAAAREGVRVIMVEPSRWLGGMTGGGISNVDWGRKEAVGGSTLEILKHHYNNAQYRRVFTDPVTKHDICVIYNHRLAESQRVDNRIQSIILDYASVDETGCPVPQPLKPAAATVEADIFIDCSYEGDLMAGSGVSYTWGRESRQQYGESLAGVRPSLLTYAIDPYKTPVDRESGLIPFVQDRSIGSPGSADKLTMGYCFRRRLPPTCRTDSAKNERSFQMTDLRYTVSAAVLWVLATSMLLPTRAAEPVSEKRAGDPNGRVMADPWVVYDGFDGPGKGKHVVLVSGDEEYRSEEALPQLGKILARHHGFKCTVLFAIDPGTGNIDPDNRRNIPGLEALRLADLMIIATRFRDLPDEQMKYVAAYLDAGKPVIGLRAAVVAFRLASPTYERFSCRSRTWKGGFGQRILGQTWISHHGRHGRESTRALVAPGAEKHLIVRGCQDIWGPTDVYTVRDNLRNESKVLMFGQILEGMQPTDRPLQGPKNDPMMPIAWTRSYAGTNGVAGRVFTTTMGAATDLENEGLRRLLVNATYWCVGLEEKIPGKANVDTVGDYKPTPFGFGKYKKGTRPSDYALGVPAARPSR